MGAEISWFAPLCDGDDDFLGNRNPNYKSTWENTSKIVKTADELGFRNVLCPSSYQVGQDTMSFVAGMASITNRLIFWSAIRCGGASSTNACKKYFDTRPHAQG